MTNPGTECTTRERILHHAMLEFAEKGYEQASTNMIAKRSGMSKGLIFHYFISKEVLFFEVVDDVLQQFMHEYNEASLPEHADFFELIMTVVEWKIKTYLRFPHMYRIIIEMYELLKQKKHPLYEKRMQETKEREWKKLLTHADLSNFKTEHDTDVYVAFAVSIFEMLGDRFVEKERAAAYTDGMLQLDNLLQQLHMASELMKYGVYKQK